jgi:aquaporin Z
MEPAKAAGYVVMQLLGALAAASSLSWLIGNGTGLGATTLAKNLRVGDQLISISPAQGCFIEAVLTFFLVNAVLHCAVSGKAGNLAGVAIGLTLSFAILMGGPLTGGSLNPARTLGPAIVTGNYADLWVYLVGPILGAVAAALLWRGTRE